LEGRILHAVVLLLSKQFEVFFQDLGFCFDSKLERGMNYRLGNKVNIVELYDQHIFYVYFNENIYEFLNKGSCQGEHLKICFNALTVPERLFSGCVIMCFMVVRHFCAT
jgi:hypothetical protein